MRYFKTFVVALVLLIGASWFASVHAQSPEVSAEVDRTQLSTDETLTLTVNLRGFNNLSPPSLPSLDGFALIGRSSSVQSTFTNGKLNAEATYDFILQPIETGKLTIQSITANLDGQPYTTEPITVEVTQGTGRVSSTPAPDSQRPTELIGQDFFAEAEVDNPTPYLGEQIVHTFRFYRAINAGGLSIFSRSNYEPPTFNGFWNNHEPVTDRYEVEAAGRRYRVFEMRTHVTPALVGTQTIHSSSMIVGGGFFSRNNVYEAQPIDVQVRPLPRDAPSGFNGAVGQFTLEAELDATQGRVNDPINMTVTLSGAGNIDTLADLVWPDMPGWRTFDGEDSVDAWISGDQIKGKRVYGRLLVPTSSGELIVPPVEFAYFNPETVSYQTISTEPIKVSVIPNPSVSQSLTSVSPEKLSPPAEKQTEVLKSDIRDIKPAPSTLNTGNSPLTSRIGYWLAWAIPVIALIAYIGWWRKARILRSDVGLARKVGAYKKATQALSLAKETQAEPYETSSRVLTDYISDRLGQAVTGLTHDGLTEVLVEHGFEPSIIGRVKTCLFTSDEGRYAPGGQAAVAIELLDETGAIISRLEEGFRS